LVLDQLEGFLLKRRVFWQMINKVVEIQNYLEHANGDAEINNQGL